MQFGRMLGVAGAASLLSFTSVAAATPANSLEGVPRVDHVVVLVLENESFSSTWSSSSPATYLNGLVKQGAFVPNYYATGHVSLDNYVAMTSGVAGAQILPTYTDCLEVNLWTCAQDVSVAAPTNVADQVESAGLSWKQYSDGTTVPCAHADYSQTAQPPDPYQGAGKNPADPGIGSDYADRHVPWLYYNDIIGDSNRCTEHVRPYSDLAKDLNGGGLPNYSFITPDTCNDGHDAPCDGGRPGGLASADAFLRTEVPHLLAWLRAHNGVLFITFDEGGTSDSGGCCTGGPAGTAGFGGQVGMLVLGAAVAPGTTTAKYDHASLLRTTEDMLGISTYLNNAASASPITGIWTQPLVTASSGPGSSSTPPPGSPDTTPPSGTIGLPNTSAAATPAGAAALGAMVILLAARARRRLRGRL